MADPALSDWLRSTGLRHASLDAASAPWGERAIDSESVTPYDTLAAAQAEAARQQPFFSGPRAIDVLRVEGLHSSLVGLPVTLIAPVEGYRGGTPVYVLAAAEIEGERATRLTVVRRM